MLVAGGGEPRVKSCLPCCPQVSPGLTLVNYVLTNNYTRSDAGALRHEWFLLPVSMEGGLEQGATACWANLTAAQQAQMVQVRGRGGSRL